VAENHRYRKTAMVFVLSLQSFQDVCDYCTATTINLSRLLAWLMGIPLDGTRVSRFAALAA
jgi:hypothetical protein